MTDPNRPTIPLNTEHVEALQAETDARRAEAKSKMTPTEITRLEVIEECSSKLEAAGVPFQLWAASADGEEGNGARNGGWWCFHKMSYVSNEDLEVYGDRVFEAWQSLLPKLLNSQTTYGNVTIVVYSGKTGNPYSIHSRGTCQFIPPPAPDMPGTGEEKG